MCQTRSDWSSICRWRPTSIWRVHRLTSWWLWPASGWAHALGNLHEFGKYIGSHAHHNKLNTNKSFDFSITNHNYKKTLIANNSLQDRNYPIPMTWDRNYRPTRKESRYAPCVIDASDSLPDAIIANSAVAEWWGHGRRVSRTRSHCHWLLHNLSWSTCTHYWCVRWNFTLLPRWNIMALIWWNIILLII